MGGYRILKRKRLSLRTVNVSYVLGGSFAGLVKKHHIVVNVLVPILISQKQHLILHVTSSKVRVECTTMLSIVVISTLGILT